MGDVLVGDVANRPYVGEKSLYIENSGGNPANTFRIDGFQNKLAIVANSAPGSSDSTAIALRTSSPGGGESDTVNIDPNNVIIKAATYLSTSSLPGHGLILQDTNFVCHEIFVDTDGALATRVIKNCPY